MPPFLAKIHNDLMDNLTYNGTSKIIKKSKYSYISDKQGYIKPVKLYIDNNFGHFDDFCLMATLL
jgi:hypothetical protein